MYVIWIPLDRKKSAMSGRTGRIRGARADIHIPNDSRLVGVRIHTAFLTLDAKAPQGVKSISEPFTFAVSK